ncbi:TA system VapC family ribonuclease toxin [Salana multivorans]
MSGGGLLLLDVNVLLALVLDGHVHGSAAHRRLAQHRGSWATTPVTEAGLVRLMLTRQVTGREVTGAEALGVLMGLRAQSGWQWLPDSSSFADSELDLSVLVGRRQVTDLHLVDVAARNGARLATFDAGLASTLVPADRQHVVVWSA